MTATSTTNTKPGVSSTAVEGVGPGTALPWRLDETDPGCFEIIGKPDGLVAPIVVSDFFDEPDDAAYIVRACNSFPAILEALEALTAAWLLTDLSPDGLVLQKIKAAIALAKGEAVAACNLRASTAGILAALEALEGYLRDTPHHNAPEAAAARKVIALARSDDTLTKGEVK